MAKIASVEAELNARGEKDGRWGGREMDAPNIRRGQRSWHTENLDEDNVYPKRT